MAVMEKPMKAQDLRDMPSDDFRYELVRGELRKMAPAGHEHGGVAINITVPLGAYVKQKGLGRVYAAETGFVLSRDPATVRAPDVAFVSKERLTNLNRKGYFPGAPDLAVEVVSPSDVYAEVEEKVAEWLAAGTKAVWVVNPRQRTLRVHLRVTDLTVLTEDDVLEGGAVVPGWRLAVAEVFA
ncbi:Uma2 family endonuclease [soil metagenome]